MQKFSKEEKAILWHLTKNGWISVSGSILHDKEIRKEFDVHKLEQAWENLKTGGWVSGRINGGRINEATAYKKLKRIFIFKLSLYHSWSFLKKTSGFIWVNSIKIIVGVAIIVLGAYLVRSLFGL